MTRQCHSWVHQRAENGCSDISLTAAHKSISCPMGKQNVGDRTVEYYSAITRKEVLTQAATWMNLENSLRERSQAQRPHAIGFH